MDSLSNIFARNCELRHIDKAAAADFLDRYHRMGSTSARHRYGLYVRRRTGAAELALESGTLVAVGTFSGARRWVKGGRRVSSYEWVRYASMDGVRVVGGMGRILKAFIDELHPDDVMSYALSDSPDGGDVYRLLGFVEEPPVSKEGFCNLKFRLKLTDY